MILPVIPSDVASHPERAPILPVIPSERSESRDL